jgi:formamidopyrimidine-DNA glycosylase
MPELPEVETIVRVLRDGGITPSILGETIREVNLLWERTLAEPEARLFSSLLVGQTIREITRRGKFLLFHLDREVLLVHLRMSGDLVVEPADAPLPTHHRLVLYFESGRRLSFNDPRKFGRVWLTPDPQSVLGGLGPEPFSADFTPERLFSMLHERRRQLKPVLLDQSFLAGLGNIYSDEALHRARLHPLRTSDSLTQAEAGRLWEAIRAVLEEGIRRNGASIDWVYRGGDFQNYFRVYQRTAEPCPVCGTPIERIVVGQRGTHFCPNCQVLEAREINIEHSE